MRQIKFGVLHTGLREGSLFAISKMPMIAELALIASQRIGGQAMLELNEASASLGGFLVGVANLVLVADPALWLFGRSVIINSFH